MANTKPKSNGKKSNSSNKSTAKTGAAKAAETRKRNAEAKRLAQERAERNKKIISEIWLWVVIAVSLVLFLSNFGVCGIIGKSLRSAMLGLFGFAGYVFPIVLGIVVGLIAYNETFSAVATKVFGTLLFFIDMTLFFHLISSGTSSKTITYFFGAGANGDFCGGVVGAFLGVMLHRFIGLAGAYIVAVVLLIISVVLLTEKSIASAINKGSRSVYDSRAERRERRLEERQRQRENRAKFVGVDFGDTQVGGKNTFAGKEKDQKQEVHEIKPKEINIEGLEETPIEDAPIEDTQESYPLEQQDKGGQIQFYGLEEEQKSEQPVNDEHATDGEFQPKERIIVSEEAKKAMSRKPYGMGDNSLAENEQIMPEESVSETKQKASNEGKIIAPPKKKKVPYKKPPMTLLADNPGGRSNVTKASLTQTAEKLKKVLATFGVNVEISNVSKGPSVTRYELQPEIGTKVSRITGLADDIKLNMAAKDIRIEAPIPGKAAVGIEIPNEGRDPVYLKELLKDSDVKNHKSNLAFPAGKDISGKVIVADIAKMPHMLIAGTTGSGKSVFTNSILMSILYRTTPDDVRVIVIDPKVVEFQVYNGIPHLMYPVVTDAKKAAGILNWAVAEMSLRYKKFAAIGARDIGSYNTRIANGDYPQDGDYEKMPQILIVIDELADLMMVAAKEVEEAICRLAQLARAAGIHMIIATQRPSVDVITGLIKANIPSRVALTVASGTDSRTIIDMNGAEKLLGNGDMLFYPAGYVKPVRVQGAYVSDKEVFDTVQYIKEKSGEADYNNEIDAELSKGSASSGNGDETDELFAEAGRLCIEMQKGSTSMLQRKFRVGFNRAARIMDQLYNAGVVGPEETNKPRKILMSIESFEEMLGKE